jgi:hypothetical protein
VSKGVKGDEDEDDKVEQSEKGGDWARSVPAPGEEAQVGNASLVAGAE